MSSTGEENQQKVMKVFSELDRQLRDLSDLPLYINSLQGASPIFRQTEVSLSHLYTYVQSNLISEYTWGPSKLLLTISSTC